MPVSSVKRAIQLIEKEPSKALSLKVGQHTVETGKFIPRADAQSPPSDITFTDATQEKTYFLVCLDLDAPFPSAGFLGPIKHWVQSGYKLQPDGTLTTSDPFTVDYIGPAPPPLSSPHRYVFFLYEQPADFDVKAHAPADGQKVASTKRMFAGLDDLEKQFKLGPCISCNYFKSN